MTGFAAGLDAGTAYTKAVIIDSAGAILGRHMEKTGYRPNRAARLCLEKCLTNASLERGDLDAVVATGFARHLISDRTAVVTELTAAARGARFLFPGVRTVLDLGGQTVKACRFDDAGRITAFRLNDKCASGTGAFLERTARIMKIPLDAVDKLAEQSTSAVPISSVCAVFAESEIISQLMGGAAPADIMRGAMKACADRAAQIWMRVGAAGGPCLAGGVARFTCASDLLREKLARPVLLPPPDMLQYVAALGAARIGILIGGK